MRFFTVPEHQRFCPPRRFLSIKLRAQDRVISNCHPSEGALKNRTHLLTSHWFYFFSLTGVTIGYYPNLHGEDKIN